MTQVVTQTITMPAAPQEALTVRHIPFPSASQAIPHSAPQSASHSASKPKSKITFAVLQGYLDRLAKILERFDPEVNKDYNDTLSNKIFEWGFEVITLPYSRHSLTAVVPENVLQDAIARVDKLKNEILVDPLTPRPAPLENPVIERNWIMNEWVYNLLVMNHRGFQGAPLSPYDDLPMEVARPHQFAREVLAWMNSLPLPSSEAASAVSVDAAAVPPASASVWASASASASVWASASASASASAPEFSSALVPQAQNPFALIRNPAQRREIAKVDRKALEMDRSIFQKEFIRILAKEYINKVERRAILKVMDEATVIYRQLWREGRERIMKDVEYAKKVAAEHEKMLSDQLGQQQANLESAVQSFEATHENIRVTREEGEKREGEHRAEVAAKIEVMQHAQKEAERVATEAHVLIQQEREVAVQKVVETERNINSKITVIVEAQKGTVDVLQGRISHVEGQNQTLSTKLHAEEQTNAANTSTIASLRQMILNQAQQINNLANQVSEGGGGCIIQ